MRKVVIASPVATQSGYGHHAREIITNIIEQRGSEWDVKLISLPWGSTPMTYPISTDLQLRLIPLPLTEQPDAIFHFTDPRYWTWLYALEHELKTTFNLPLIYYSIWDDLPYPMWNAPYYASCDLIMGISKQSDNIHREVLKQSGY